MTATVSDGWTDLSGVPLALRRDGAVELDGTLGFYVEDEGALVMLNPTAAAIWASCDGRTGFDALVAELAEAHGVPGAAIRADVRRTLGRLAELGLVGPAPPA